MKTTTIEVSSPEGQVHTLTPDEFAKFKTAADPDSIVRSSGPKGIMQMDLRTLLELEKLDKEESPNGYYIEPKWVNELCGSDRLRLK